MAQGITNFLTIHIIKSYIIHKLDLEAVLGKDNQKIIYIR